MMAPYNSQLVYLSPIPQVPLALAGIRPVRTALLAEHVRFAELLRRSVYFLIDTGYRSWSRPRSTLALAGWEGDDKSDYRCMIVMGAVEHNLSTTGCLSVHSSRAASRPKSVRGSTFGLVQAGSTGNRPLAENADRNLICILFVYIVLVLSSATVGCALSDAVAATNGTPVVSFGSRRGVGRRALRSGRGPRRRPRAFLWHRD